MRHDSPLTPGGLPRGGRILIETVVASSSADVTLTLPTSPYTRFVVEIDDLASSITDRILLCRIGAGGSIRSLAADYEFSVYCNYSDGSDEYESRNADHMAMSSNANNVRFGAYVDVAPDASRIPMNTGSYTVQITPGNGTNSTPKVWWNGAYFSSEGISDRRLVHVSGGGLYKGWTSLTYGRADEIQFLFDSNTINRGTFRLYGTE